MTRDYVGGRGPMLVGGTGGGGGMVKTSSDEWILLTESNKVLF